MARISVGRRAQASLYWPVISHRVLGRMLPGMVVSCVGDGMSSVAVGWLAIQLAPALHREIWVAVAAYTLPGAVGTLAFNRFLRHRSGAELAGWDALLRTVTLGAIPVIYVFDGLSISVYVVLLAMSSLLRSWGSAGRFTLLAEVLPPRHRLAGNAVVTTVNAIGTVAGPLAASLSPGVARCPSSPSTRPRSRCWQSASWSWSHRLTVSRGRSVIGAPARPVYGWFVMIDDCPA